MQGNFIQTLAVIMYKDYVLLLVRYMALEAHKIIGTS